ncbi:MAG: Phenylalanine-tRNA ligase beta subunit [Berkelbacteria bacterium GW2011_GWA1_36_9]|uniref:Phenylalanine--tRNA ligase beta subunit n=1 Tax=Berkelbacteria bacterium GW2011_GWA1_36_9 TaxID=1618331 RepID=A0A0G0FGM5_9BACT|nr:MAG: Phenylalanine-tRNA ligase beta subunit [Berkelbacteria bacterium GW2011_GWA1_36_9]
MKISYNWLKDYVEIEKSPEQLANDLSSFGFTVESLEKIGDDFVLDLEINPNRGDCLSILGIAREVAALYDKKIKSQIGLLKANLKINEDYLDKNVKVTISDSKICPRFTARIIDNITIKPSPEWLQKRLTAYGFRPINNIVDITNYVMVAMGQPLHAFDWSKIQDGQMNIHTTYEGEELITLDGKNHKLPKDTIVISDEKKIYDLAGIMGGFSTEVDSKTKTIVLQSAIFNPVLIRRSSKKLAHTTDASYRYERGVDYNNTIFGADLASSLIKESCPEVKIGKLIDIKSEDIKEQNIVTTQDNINILLGTNITSLNIKDYLERLNFKTSNIDDKLTVTVPSFRVFDVKIWQDLAEEIARIYGYDKIDSNLLSQIKLAPINKNWQERMLVKDELASIGFSEIYSPSLIRKNQIEITGFSITMCQEITNPISVEMQYLRPSLMPTLLSAISKNPWAPEIAIFEVGKVFYSGKESWQVGLAVTNNLDQMLKKTQEKLSLKKEIIDIDQKILDFYKIRRKIKMIIFEIMDVNITEGDITQKISQNQYSEISKYPPTVRDLAFIVSDNIKADTVSDVIRHIDDKILMVELFDEFKSDKFGENKKNLAFHIWLQDLKGPVLDDETNTIFENIIKIIEEKFQAKLRS